MNKIISVVIPTYNREKLISRAVKSVLAQTYTDLEVIVVDDASTDDTETVVKKIESDRLRYIKIEKNGGACRARNAGIRAAKGDYIAFLDSDDTWNPDKLEKQIKYMQEKKAEAVACNGWNIKADEKRLIANQQNKETADLNELLNANFITTGALLVKKELLIKIGCFDERLPRYQDWDLVLRIAKVTDIYFLTEPLYTLYFQENSITNSTSKEKKLAALKILYEKNEALLQENRKADAHFRWSMGMYSLYTERPRYDYLKAGYTLDGFDTRRFAIYCAIRIGLKGYIKRQYGKNH